VAHQHLPQPQNAEHNRRKASFDDIYDQPDPRAYFRRLQPLDYCIPQQARPVLRDVLSDRFGSPPGGTPAGSGPAAVLDLCCSYGINAALLNHHLTLADLYEHYTSPAVAELSTAELASLDKEFYASRRRADAVPVLGLDAAGLAVGYATSVGLIDAAFPENLEESEPSSALRRALADVALITVTGGIGYIGERTIDTLLRHTGPQVWITAFVLRTIDYRPITRAARLRGLHTIAETSRTYLQRRFADPAEQAFAIEQTRRLGHDPRGKEADGYYHSIRFDTRPRERLQAPPGRSDSH
jgi:hypothetical protein